MPTKRPRRKKAGRRAARPRPPWRALIRDELVRLDNETNLQDLYTAIESSLPKDQLTLHWRAKVRQQLQLDPLVERVSQGVWRFNPPGS
jgi:hypothetical protein